MMTHTNEKPFHCSHCDRSFNHLWNLEEHMMIHSNDESFSRSGHGRSFNQSISFKKRNMMIHKNGQSNLSLAKKAATRKLAQVHAENKKTSAASFTSKSFSGDDSEKKPSMDIHNCSSLSRNQTSFKEESLKNDLVIRKQNESPSSSRYSQLPSREESGLQSEVVPCIDNSFVCSLCHQSFLEKQAFENHLLTHTPDESSAFSSDLSPLQEKKSNTGTQTIPINEQSLSCSNCKQFFPEKEALEKHNALHHFTEEFKSPHNRISYSSQRSNSLHDVETSIRDIQTSLKFHRCNQKCMEKAALKSFIIRICRHPFYCADCGHLFPEMKSLKKHVMVHTNSKLKAHSYSDCNRSFARKSTLESHRLSHTIIPRYACSQCSQSFARKGELKQHAELHGNKKHFTCACCNQSFSYKRALKEHILSHKNQEIRSSLSNCQLFIAKNKLTEHEIIDLETGPPFDHQDNTRSRLHSKSNNSLYQESNTSSVLLQSPNLELNSETSNGVSQGLTNTIYLGNASQNPGFDNICDLNPNNMGHVHRENTNLVSSHNIQNNTVEEFLSCFLCQQPFFKKDDSQLISMVHSDETHHTCAPCTQLFTELGMIRNGATSPVFNSVHEESSDFDFDSEISDYIQQEGIASCSVS